MKAIILFLSYSWMIGTSGQMVKYHINLSDHSAKDIDLRYWSGKYEDGTLQWTVGYNSFLAAQPRHSVLDGYSVVEVPMGRDTINTSVGYRHLLLRFKFYDAHKNGIGDSLAKIAIIELREGLGPFRGREDFRLALPAEPFYVAMFWAYADELHGQTNCETKTDWDAFNAVLLPLFRARKIEKKKASKIVASSH